MGGTVAIGKKPRPVRSSVSTAERQTRRKLAEKFGCIGVYDSGNRDWVASMALVAKLYPDYKN